MRFLLFIIFPLVLHPVHISMTNIDINSDTRKISIVIKVFSDDFQKIINRNYKINLDINDSVSIFKYRKQISNYITKNLKLIVNNKSLINNKLTFKQTKSNHQATWFYFVINKKVKPQKITIINNLLNDLFQDQKNLVFIKYNGIQKSFKLSKNDKMRNLTYTTH